MQLYPDGFDMFFVEPLYILAYQFFKMLMVFSENRTNKTVSAITTAIRNNSQVISPSIITQATMQENMFARLQNVKKCSSCGK